MSPHRAPPDSEATQATKTLEAVVADQQALIRTLRRELAKAQQALRERRLVDRAKCRLMEHQGLSEADAYRRLREQAMARREPMSDTAARLLADES